MKRPRLTTLLVLPVLASCAAIRIDVDVYKGPLANHQEVQLLQLMTLADGAKPILVTLRDQLQFAFDQSAFDDLADDAKKQRVQNSIELKTGVRPRDVSDWRHKQYWYRPDFVAESDCNSLVVKRGRISKEVKQLEDEKKILESKMQEAMNKLDDSRISEETRLAMNSQINQSQLGRKDLESLIAQKKLEQENLSRNAKGSFAYVRGSGISNLYSCFADERAFRINIILGSYDFDDPLNAVVDRDVTNRPADQKTDLAPAQRQSLAGQAEKEKQGVVGLSKLREEYRKCTNSSDPCIEKGHLADRLIRAYLSFGERLLVMANSEALQRRTTVRFPFSEKEKQQEEVDRYVAFLQSIGNSIQVAADELIHKNHFVATSRKAVPSELVAQRAAVGKNALEVMDDVLETLRQREAKVTSEESSLQEQFANAARDKANKLTQMNTAEASYTGDLNTTTAPTENVTKWPAKYVIYSTRFWNGKCLPDVTPDVACKDLVALTKSGIKIRALLKNSVSQDKVVDLNAISVELDKLLAAELSAETDAKAKAALEIAQSYLGAAMAENGFIAPKSGKYPDLEKAISQALDKEGSQKEAQLAGKYSIREKTKTDADIAIAAWQSLQSKLGATQLDKKHYQQALSVLPPKKKELLGKASDLALLKEPTAFFGMMRDFVSGEAEKAAQEAEAAKNAPPSEKKNAEELSASWNSARRVMLELNPPPTTPKRMDDLQCSSTPCATGDKAARSFEKQIEVLDNLINMLRYELIEAKKTQGEVGRTANIEQALREAYEQRSGLTYLRPATSYLRSISSATVLQDSNGSGHDNMLGGNLSWLVPNFLEKDVHLKKIRGELDKQFWHNINNVTLSGGGDANYVIAKDDIGNWYVKAYATDPSQVYRSATSLGMFALGGKMDLNLFDRLDEERRLKKQIDAKDDVPGARARLDQLRKEQPSTTNSSLGKVFVSYKDVYVTKTKESLDSLSGEINEESKFKQRIADSWKATLKDSTVKLRQQSLSDLVAPLLSTRYEGLKNQGKALGEPTKNIILMLGAARFTPDFARLLIFGTACIPILTHY